MNAKGTFLFTGKNSLGYVQGEVYELKVLIEKEKITILSPHRCPYDSYESFFENWTVAKKNKPSDIKQFDIRPVENGYILEVHFFSGKPILTRHIEDIDNIKAEILAIAESS